MNKKNILLWILVLLCFYPAISAFNAGEILDVETRLERVESSVASYHLSIWLSWVVMVCVAIYYKWITQSNFFFYFIYGFLIVAFIIYGFLMQEMVNTFDITSGFRDNYTQGVIVVLVNLVVAGALTGFLQAGVWWFTRRWHRR